MRVGRECDQNDQMRESVSLSTEREPESSAPTPWESSVLIMGGVLSCLSKEVGEFLVEAFGK